MLCMDIDVIEDAVQFKRKKKRSSKKKSDSQVCDEEIEKFGQLMKSQNFEYSFGNTEENDVSKRYAVTEVFENEAAHKHFLNQRRKSEIDEVNNYFQILEDLRLNPCPIVLEPEDDPVFKIMLSIFRRIENEDEKERKRKRLEKKRTIIKERLKRHGTTHLDNEVLVVADDLNHFRDVLRKRFINTQTRMMREPTFSKKFKEDVSKVEGMSKLTEKLRNVTMADLELPDRTGWLYDQAEHKDVWCVLADMLFCIFENESSEKPNVVVLLPGCSIRSLVYRSVNAKGVSSKTVSGIDKYQMIIDDCSSRKKYLFSLDNQFEQEEWMELLKSASKLDNETNDNTSIEQRRHSFASISSRPQGSNISPMYAPSPKTTANERSSYAWNDINDDKNGNEEQDVISRNHTVRTSIGDIRRKLRRDHENESNRSVPVKATHFQTSQKSIKKPTTFQKIRSFGSLESLFRPKRRQSTSSSEENGDTNSMDETDKEDSSSQDSGLVKSHNKGLSQSLDFGKSEKGLSKGIVRTASDLKERLLKSSSDKSWLTKLKLKDIQHVSISGFLQYKYLIKWQKLWCVVDKGCLYGFRSQSPEENAELAVKLTRCEVTYVSDQDKRFKRMFVFKLTQRNKKSIYLNACNNADLSRWLQILQMESSKIQCDSDLEEPPDKDVKPIPRPRNGVKHAFAKAELSKRHSMPNGLFLHKEQTECDFSSSADDSEYPIGIDKYRKTVLPQHDETLKQVWEKDKNYLFNVVRAKLNTYKQHTNSIVNKDINGSQGDGLHIVTDGKTLSQLDREAKGSTGREVRRSHSFHIKPQTKMADEEYPDSPASSRKRHKPMTVKKMAPSQLGECSICGCLERRLVNGEWIRYWYALKDGSLFSFLTEDDTTTVDIQDVHGYSVLPMVDKFRGKRFAIKLSHETMASTYLSADSRDDMEVWVEKLQSATGQEPSEHSQVETNEDNDNDKYEEKCQSVKQKLLQEMLRQKRELELKQAARQKKQQTTSNDMSGGYVQDDQLISDVIRLRQRRMSTQIKMDTIQKQMQPQSTGRKFPFGKKKKVDENKSEHLQEQLNELSERLQNIDRDISQKEMLDLNQNRKPQNLINSEESVLLSSGLSTDNLNDGRKEEESSRGGSQKFKNSVQKLAQKTKKSIKNKSKKQSTEVPKMNGLLNSSGNSNGTLNLDLSKHEDDVDSDTSESHDLRKSGSSLIDLTKSKSSITSDDVFDSKSDTSLSPRKEIDPTVLAEIDAFEELTRQVLNARSTS